MKDGKYKVDSVEQGLVKIILKKNESIEEQLPRSAFPYTPSEGLVLQVTSDKGAVMIMPLFEETKEEDNELEEELEK